MGSGTINLKELVDSPVVSESGESADRKIRCSPQSAERGAAGTTACATTTIYGLRRLGPQRARGIAVIDDKASPADLDAMAKAGVCGIRINLETAGIFDPAASAKKLETAVAQLRDRPWHLQMYTRPAVIVVLEKQLESLLT